MLETLQLILGIAETDTTAISILNYYITQAQQYFLSETNLTNVPISAQNIIIDLVTIMWNKRGSEGLTAENHGGISYTWQEDIPDLLKRQIIYYRVIAW